MNRSKGFENTGRWLSIDLQTSRTNRKFDQLTILTLILLITFLLGTIASAKTTPQTVRCIYDFRDHDKGETFVFNMLGDLLDDTNDLWLVDFSKDTKILNFQQVTGARVHRIHSNQCRLL